MRIRTPQLLAALLFVLPACHLRMPWMADEEPPPRPPADIAPQPAPNAIHERYRATAESILRTALDDSQAYPRLQYLCDHIGHRLSGSEGLAAAVDWCAATMEADGLDRVAKEPVKVPVWVRGEESAALVAPTSLALPMLGLGGSVGTPDGGIEAEVVVVGDFDELEAVVAQDPHAVEGRIVLYDHPMAAYDPEKGAGYGKAVVYRLDGASRAAKYGAAAILIRSVTATSLQTPHTGMLRYAEDQPRIPAAALTLEHAALLHRLYDDGTPLRIRLSMQARTLPDAMSANVVGELRGRALPDEVVVIGGHLDSWDVGHGAHDDGGACIAVMEALRILKSMGLRPRRTIRAVLFTNEENGLRGGRTYAKEHAGELPLHVAAIESDSGVYRPLGFSTPKPKDARGQRIRARLRDMVDLLAPIGATELRDGGGGADIGPMAPAGVPQLGLRVEGSRYFHIHHTHADTFDKVSQEDLDRCVGALAALAFMIADNPERLDAEERD